MTPLNIEDSVRPDLASASLSLTPRQRASWLAHLFKAVTRSHHGELRPLLAPYIPADAVVIDIGAHAGQFSKLFARMAPQGQVHAFEPSAYARSVMRPALAINRLRNVTLYPVGLSDCRDPAILHTPIKPSGSLGFGTARLGAELGGAVDQIVVMTTLDAFARALSRVDFIKAEIEGWELRALKGGEQTLRRYRPALYLEVDDACLIRAGDTPSDLFTWLGSLGYHAVRAPRGEPAPHWSGAGDYLFKAT